MRRAVLVGVALVLVGVAAVPLAQRENRGLTAQQARLAVIEKLNGEEQEHQEVTATRPGKAWALTPRNFTVRATTSRLAASTPSFGQPTIAGVQGVGFEEDLRLDPSNANRLYASVPGSLSSDTSWVWRSLDGGKTFKWVPGAAPQTGKVTTCAG